MDFNNFVEKAKKFDNRNSFGKVQNVSYLPFELQDFYAHYNPVDVEVPYKGMPMQFISMDDLSSVQSDYSLPNGAFIFATINGDPIFILDGKIFRSLAEKYQPEKLADTFEAFIKSI